MSDFTTPHDQLSGDFDTVKLPSKGAFYVDKKDYVKVEQLTTLDDDILLSPGLSLNGKMLDVLLEKKIVETPVRPTKLLLGDKMKIIIYLRATGIDRYLTNYFVDPKTNKEFEYKVDLLSLKDKELDILPTDEGYFEVTLPHSGSKAKIKLIDGNERTQITEEEKKFLENSRNGVSNKNFLTLRHAIVEIDGIRDSTELIKIISGMKIPDSRYIRKMLTDLEPGVDFAIDVPTPSGEVIKGELTIDGTFFYPEV